MLTDDPEEHCEWLQERVCKLELVSGVVMMKMVEKKEFFGVLMLMLWKNRLAYPLAPRSVSCIVAMNK